MGYASGNVSFRKFRVVGNGPATIDQPLLDKLAERVIKPNDMGVPEESEYGWCGGQHIYDGQFTFERNVFNDAVVFALRIDTNKVPAAVRLAHEKVEEEAVAKANTSGFVSKQQKKAVKELVKQKLEDELRSGKHRKSKMVAVLWDVPAGIVYCQAAGATLEKLLEIFERTFDLQLHPHSAGTAAMGTVESTASRRVYEDTKPTRFVLGPDGDGAHPEYPWTAKGPEPKDFLGNEFLVWLWHEADGRTSLVKTPAGDITVMIDRGLDLDCAYGQTGKDTIRGVGPSHTPEARDALRVGKVPRRVGLVIDHHKQQFSLTLQGESLGVAGAKLPAIEDADTPRKLFEERITLIRDLAAGVDALFATFLAVRLSSQWDAEAKRVGEWIRAANQPRAEVEREPSIDNINAGIAEAKSRKNVTTADGRKITAGQMIEEMKGMAASR